MTTPAHPATTGTVADGADGVFTVALDDGSSVQGKYKATAAPPVAVGQRVVLARSGNTWVILDTIAAVV